MRSSFDAPWGRAAWGVIFGKQSYEYHLVIIIHGKNRPIKVEFVIAEHSVKIHLDYTPNNLGTRAYKDFSDKNYLKV